MFKDKNAIAIVPCGDLARAKAFYTEKLGLAIEAEMDGVMTLRTGATFLNVYQTDKAGTNEANAVVWDLGSDFDAIVEELQGKGVVFEQYDMDGMTLEGDVHVTGDFRAVWFKDPDGNILHANNM